jgi:hypothetical protein
VKNVSGKLVILSIVAVAVAAAGTSWWFRYNATRRAAEFWGPDVVRLIRDAPSIELLKLAPADESPASNTLTIHDEQYRLVTRIDASFWPGMTHLRNALLEDRSFKGYNVQLESWPNKWRWALIFRDGQNLTTVLFSDDCKNTTLSEGHGQTARCDPIAAGLREMFAELSSQQPAAAR